MRVYGLICNYMHRCIDASDLDVPVGGAKCSWNRFSMYVSLLSFLHALKRVVEEFMF